MLWYDLPEPCSCWFCIHSGGSWTWRCQREYFYNLASGQSACIHVHTHHTCSKITFKRLSSLHQQIAILDIQSFLRQKNGTPQNSPYAFCSSALSFCERIFRIDFVTVYIGVWSVPRLVFQQFPLLRPQRNLVYKLAPPSSNREGGVLCAAVLQQLHTLPPPMLFQLKDSEPCCVD